MRALAVPLLLLAVIPLISAQLPDNAPDLPLSHLLTLAQTALSTGKTSDALSIYDYCLERDPSDFTTLYKRATVRLASGQYNRAKEGFHQVLEVREYEPARLQLGKIHAKLGEFPKAREEIDIYLRAVKGKEGSERDVTEATDLRKQVVKAETELAAARKAVRSTPPNLERCLTALTSAINFAPQSEELRLLRAECALLAHDFDSAVADLSRASAISPALPTHLQLRISLLSSLFLDHGLSIPSDSLLAIKKCLNADPDSKPCRKAFKALKAAEKDLSKLRNWLEADRWTEVAVTLAGSSTKDGVIAVVRSLIETYQQPLDLAESATSPLPSPENAPTLAQSSPLLTALLSSLCHSYIALNTSPRKTAAACAEVLTHDPEDTWGMVGKSEALMKEENYEEAVRMLSDAFERTGRSDREVLSRLQKAQRLLKQSKQKDYYKILGVARDADAKTIKRAYRKATLKAHPDKEGGSEEKMAALNQAYEVISNPELRARFDQGEDPNDPSNQGGGGNPFQGGGFGGQQMFFQQGGFPGGSQFFGGGGGGGQQFNFRWG
ncbi:uncharacterized protein JCM15063_005934 [Sporobolomyces koalae]|uniref:uncharacterized protein n=1 Tax=Sporobolomyces koalae TaxID=500713 RepID=UPI0031786233